MFEFIEQMRQQIVDFTKKFTPQIPKVGLGEETKARLKASGYDDKEIDAVLEQKIRDSALEMVTQIPTSIATGWSGPMPLGSVIPTLNSFTNKFNEPVEMPFNAGQPDTVSKKAELFDNLEQIPSPDMIKNYTNVIEGGNNKLYGIPKQQQAETTQENTSPHRVELWNTWKEESPDIYQQLLEATKNTSGETGVPQSLLMDIAGLESTGGKYTKQLSGGPGRGAYQFEVDENGDIPEDMQNIANSIGLENFDPLDIGQATKMAGELIKRGQLSRWGTQGGNWGTMDNQNRAEDERISNYYSNEELNQYMSPNYAFKS